MFIFELMVALLKTVAGNYTVYPDREDEEINEPRVEDPEYLAKIQEDDFETITCSSSGDPADRIRDWENEKRREKAGDIDPDKSVTFNEYHDRDPERRIVDWETSQAEQYPEGCSDGGSFWDSQCSEAAESMGGDNGGDE